MFRRSKLLEEKAEFAWAQFPWSENIKQKETKAGVAAIQCRLHYSGMQLCSISFILGLMMLLNDLPCLSSEKFNASWALYWRGLVYRFRELCDCKAGKPVHQAIVPSRSKCINCKMTSFQPYWILNTRIVLLWNELMSENLSTVFLINSLISSKHWWAKKIITDGNKVSHLGMGQHGNANWFQFTPIVFRPFSIC